MGEAQAQGERRGYAVIHESELGPGETHFGFASSPYFDTDPLGRAENQLAYCRGMQEREQPGSDGRYFIVEIREVGSRG